MISCFAYCKRFAPTLTFRYIDNASRIFDGRISIDLMLGRPGQTLEGWRAELEMV